ncbi:MAG: YhdP family protein, partial [Povalibacter sp.]
LFSTFKVEGHGLDLAGWADVLPNQWLAPETGHGSIEVVSTFLGVHPVTLSAKVDMSNVSAVSPEWLTPLPVADPLVPKVDETLGTSAAPDSAKTAAVTPVLTELVSTESQPTDSGSIEPTSSEPLSTEPKTTDGPAFEAIDDSELAANSSPRAMDLVAFDRVAFNLQAKLTDNTWTVAVRDIDLSRKDSAWRSKNVDVKWSRSEEQGLSVDASADRVVLQNLWPVLAYLPESETTARLRALNARGSIDNLAFTLARASQSETPRYSIKADISELGFDPVLNTPGLNGFSAHVEGTEAGGAARIRSTHLTFELPKMFRWPLEAQSVDSVIAWERLPEGLRISSDALDIVSEDGNAHLKLALTLPGGEASPTLELSGTADDLNIGATSKYLPGNKLTPKTLAWLDAALVSGRVKTADVNLRGPLRNFPFRKREGEFLIRAQVENTTFNYQEGWAPAEQLMADVEFHNEGMRVLSGTANIGGLNLVKVAGEFPDFHAGNVSVKTQARGDLKDALPVLQSSPLSSALGDLFQTLSGEGPVEADVSLRLPLKHMVNRRILVNTRLVDATLRSSKIAAPMTALNGRLTVRESLPQSARFEAQWLGGPVAIAIDPVDAATPASELKATGHAVAAELTPVLNLPSSVKISGGTDWQFTMPLETSRENSATPRQPRKLTVESDLAGLGLAMPYPLGKSEQERRPLRVDVDYDGDNTMLTRATFGDLRTLIRLQSDAQGWHLDRAGVRPDAVAAALPAHPGFAIDGAVDRLNLDDWFALKGNGSGSGAPLSDFLKTANLRVGSLSVFGYQFPDVRGVLRTNAGTWQVDVAGPNAEGSLSVPENFKGAQALTAKLDRLVITPQEKGDAKADGSEEADPRSWPNLQAQVQDFRYGEHAFGTVSMQASRVPLGVRVDSLTVVQDAARGEAHGEWLITPDGPRSRMSVLMTSTDVAATLKALSYTPFIDAKRGEITAELSWPGGFSSELLTRAGGTVTVLAENGQLLNVQPGAGRVLGLFSVAALPRRLSLDFSDLTDKGLSFDSIHGDFDMREGNAFTSNLLLRGPAAEIGIAGRTGIGSRDYDQTAIVTGNLGASLPVAGALAGGPAVGAALLLFSQVFKEPLKGITRGYYRITGPWDNPVVERVDAAQIKEAAASTKDGA